MRKMLMSGLLAAMSLMTAPLAFAESTEAATGPEQIVRKTTDDIIALLKKNKAEYAKDTKKLYAMVDERVLPVFDFERMSQWVLGRYWKQTNDDQRQRFTKEFRNLLVRTYATALLNYTDQKVAIQPVAGKASNDEVTVKTEIQQSGGAPSVPIHYAFYKGEAGWKVFDVTIDGVSLVSNYRSTYASKIKQQGIDGLIDSIAASNARPQASGQTTSKAR